MALCVAAVMLAAGCRHDDEGINVTPGQLYGTWHKAGTAEYWTYRNDASGAKWDESEGFSEDFPSFRYTWSVDRDQLQYTTLGDTINVPITRIYTIKKIDEKTMVREEEIGTYTLVKVGS